MGVYEKLSHPLAFVIFVITLSLPVIVGFFAMRRTRNQSDFFVGGRGYCLWLVGEGTGPDTRYNSPENVLAIAGGPFCGESSFPGAGKFIVGTISPLTGTFVDSNVGGHFLALAKEAGFDAIAVTGRSAKEVMLVIDGDAGEIALAEAPGEEGGITVAEKILAELAVHAAG